MERVTSFVYVVDDDVNPWILSLWHFYERHQLMLVPFRPRRVNKWPVLGYPIRVIQIAPWSVLKVRQNLNLGVYHNVIIRIFVFQIPWRVD